MEPTRTPLKRHWLRHAVFLVLHDVGRPMQVRELVAELARRGLTTVRTTESRAVSDALRAEVRAGRVRRIGWGRYVMARSTSGHVRYARRCVDEVIRGVGRRQPLHD
jgi:hypothetical protein